MAMPYVHATPPSQLYCMRRVKTCLESYALQALTFKWPELLTCTETCWEYQFAAKRYPSKWPICTHFFRVRP